MFKNKCLRTALFAVIAMIGATFAADMAVAKTKITLAVPNPSAITWMPLWVAIGQGFFAKEGIEITVEAVDGSSQVLQAMSAGQAMLGAPGPGPVLSARARGVDVVYLYNLYPKSVFGLMVREGSSYKKPSDLKGKVIGVGTADGAEVSFTRAILNDIGFKEGKDYTFLPVGDGGIAAAAFERGEVEAYAAAVSDAAILRSRGLALREITPEPYLAYFGNGFAVMRSYMKKNPKVVEGFGRALVRGMRFMLNPANKNAVLDNAKAGNPQEGEDRKFAAALLAAVTERMTPTDRFMPKGFGYMPPAHWEIWHKTQIETGAIKAPLPNLKAAYTNKLIGKWNAR